MRDTMRHGERERRIGTMRHGERERETIRHGERIRERDNQ